ncbi:MAG TPA: hypothetical protein VKH37_02990 [Ferruginibacter sp.]|nr:hypothetical protein [Ferruginibacter sp.]
MRYKITPFNFLCALLLCFELFFWIFVKPAPGDKYSMTNLIWITLAAIGIDFLLQLVIKKKNWITVIEVVLILLAIWYYEKPFF